ncbi:MAG: peptidyl-prolyl cis-trans isomerase [Candidatus Tectomicrobia bacterium]|uniref:Peptidyl-prolyl cis-trans isomerase n=1 Tax=Tectimicrobiota bacterium TaxID=2528274 RepID=A0A933LR98_UNCTE|nr:peptidyl-prolyl cis-trans isomerase [Candidatus Tectomicrobia bacterium]
MLRNLIVLAISCFTLLSLGSLVIAEGQKPQVLITTSLGEIVVELWPDKAPISVENFLTYVKEGFYDGLIFHRVMGNFMIQGGGFDAQMKNKQPTHPPIKNEAGNGLKNERGTLAMARTNVVDSATSQFFINVVDNSPLNHKSTNPQEFGYAVFGKVIKGMETVDKIKAVKTTTKGPHQNVPEEPVVINSMKVTQEK